MAERKFTLAFAELVDRLVIDQIKEVKLPRQRATVRQEMALLSSDLDQIAEERGLKLTARVITLGAALAQLNVQIWDLKDRMTAGDGDYNEQLVLAHKLNGVRNQIKNMMMAECGDTAPGAARTNFNTDGLEGMDLFVLNGDHE